MEIITKTFEELSIHELHDLLLLRSEVFVVEQDCVYQDVDGKDPKALHVLGLVNNKIVAYTRCFAQGIYFEEASIGRVVVDMEHRKFKLGHEIMKASMEAIKKYYNTEKVKLSAQEYLQEFYKTLGFHQIGEGYLEDGIRHIAMVSP